jgi:outer membrane assembly lipoprotein YfiO
MMPSDLKWQTAENYFNRKKYNKAVPYYEQLLFERNSIYTADAQFKIGECYFRVGKFVDAIFEYQELIRLFPDNSKVADAQFQIGIAYYNLSSNPHYDQSETERAIEAFAIFNEKFPQDNRTKDTDGYINEMQLKLIEKLFINGYIYFKMKDYPASQLYLREVMAHNLLNNLDKRSAYYNALIHIDRRERDDAMAYIEFLQKHFPNSKEYNSALKRFSRIDSKLWHYLYFY